MEDSDERIIVASTLLMATSSFALFYMCRVYYKELLTTEQLLHTLSNLVNECNTKIGDTSDKIDYGNDILEELIRSQKSNVVKKRVSSKRSADIMKGFNTPAAVRM